MFPESVLMFDGRYLSAQVGGSEDQQAKFSTRKMPFFSKSSAASSSVSLLIPAKEKPAQKDYEAAFGALSSQYGSSGYSPAANPIRVALPTQSQSQRSSAPKNVKPVRAKDLGALQNKYGAIAYGGMTSVI
ncbi:hypothetical protein RhiJN_25742 [Ceratobasidium sp. AG-Ba]|nr:hypothetical protein RhiJN_25742 [Ceratobasidium sp. AG-Ba]